MRIGLTYTGTDLKHENYVRWLKGEDGEAIEVIRLSAEDGNVEEIEACDGLVLSGGIDIDPEYYGGSKGYVKAPAGGWQPERDAFERAALERAWAKGLPVLGVCRGLQLINVCLEGSLIQDLGTAGDETHENVAGTDKRHLVNLEKGSLLREIAGAEKGEANSAHHQSIDQPGKGLRINCRAEDGTIEGIEWEDPAGKSFLLGIQWHPERMYLNRFADVFLYSAIRDRFIYEIKKSKAIR
jgi:putative glutamine amidotransferase